MPQSASRNKCGNACFINIAFCYEKLCRITEGGTDMIQHIISISLTKWQYAKVSSRVLRGIILRNERRKQEIMVLLPGSRPKAECLSHRRLICERSVGYKILFPKWRGFPLLNNHPTCQNQYTNIATQQVVPNNHCKWNTPIPSRTHSRCTATRSVAMGSTKRWKTT